MLTSPPKKTPIRLGANMKEKLFNFLLVLCILVVITGIIYNTMRIINDVNLDDSDLQKIRYDSVVNANIVLQSKMDSTIEAMAESTQALNYIIETKTAQIQTIKGSRNEGSYAISKFSTAQLSKFLTEELYKDSFR